MIAVTIVALALASSAGDPRGEATVHLRLGNEALAAGENATAIKEYRQAYELVPSARLLYNLGLASEAAGKATDALGFFRRFLRESSADEVEPSAEMSESIATAEARVAELERELGRAEVKLPPSAAAAPPPTRAGPDPHLLADPRADLVAPPRPPVASARSRWWLVAAGVVAAGTVTALLVARARSNACPPQFLDCF